MRRIALFLLVLFASNANGSDCKYFLQTGEYELCVAGKPLSFLPKMFSFMADVIPNKEEFYSRCAEDGNEAFSHIKETQDNFCWYQAEIVPRANWDADFVWQGKIALTLKKGGLIEANEVIGMLGFRKGHGNAALLTLYPQTRLFSFENMAVTRGGVKKCLVFVSFPRGEYETKEVKEILFLEEGS